MSLAYFDCFAGAGGDMIVGSLLDAGADMAALTAELAKLKIAGCQIRAETVTRGGLAGVRFEVEAPAEDQPHRRLGDIIGLIERAGLAARAAARARKIFTRLAEAEARVHRIDVEEVHFHEVGAVDSIVDVAAACIAMELLSVDTLMCSPIPMGSGTVQCAHGRLPVPAPATAELLRGARTCQTDLTGELTTPTAAAVLTTLAKAYGPPPSMEVSAVGYGAGLRDGGAVPNLLRVFLGQPSDAGTVDSVVELSANIDDCTGEILGATIEKLLAAGCADAWAVPVFMKKSRPAWMLSALCSLGKADAAEEIIFRETTTIGLRRRICQRSKLDRCLQTVETPYGPIRMKIATWAGRTMTVSPEFSDCLSAAQTHAVAVKEVIRAAEAAYGKESP